MTASHVSNNLPDITDKMIKNLKEEQFRWKREQENTVEPSKLNFSFGGHLATTFLGLVAKGFF